MKRLLPGLVAVVLFAAVGLPSVQADMLYPRAAIPPKQVQAERDAQNRRAEGYPTYAIAAGVVAVALTGSFLALRRIRKRSGV